MTWKKGSKAKITADKNMTKKTNEKNPHYLTFAQTHLDDPQNFWENVLWTGERKFNFFFAVTSAIKLTGFSKRNTTHALKHGGGGMMGFGRHAGLHGRIIICRKCTIKSNLHQVQVRLKVLQWLSQSSD